MGEGEGKVTVRILALQNVRSLIPGPGSYVTFPCRQDPEMRGLPWIIQLGPCSHKGPSKGKREAGVQSDGT